MMYITAIHEENDTITEVRQIYSLDRPDIMFQFSVDVIKHGMRKGNLKKTAVTTVVDGKPAFIEGQEVMVCKDGHLRTINDDDVSNNLSSLPKF